MRPAAKRDDALLCAVERARAMRCRCVMSLCAPRTTAIHRDRIARENVRDGEELRPKGDRARHATSGVPVSSGVM